MIAFKRFSPNLTSGFWAVVMIISWLAFAPTQAGGLASYIIVIGNSMEPNFHIGDLVIVHEETEYKVGDAVVYDNLELNNFVFHRIIEQELGRFTLQGDNNSWTDTYQPSKDEVLGKFWVYIPKGGNAIQKIRNPFVMAAIAGILGAILATGFFTNKSKGEKRMNNNWLSSFKQKMREWFAKTDGSEPFKSPSSRENLLEGLLFTLGLVTFASLVLGIISFSRPVTRTVKDEISYDQLGIFAYSASAPQGVYDANAVKSGDPIFPNLTCAADVTFQYTLISQQAKNITGTYQMTATISEPSSGWQRTVDLQDEATFSGNAVGTNAQLNLCSMEKLTQSMEANTDFHPGSYVLTISPNIRVNGEVSGRALDSTFAPELTFIYDRIHFYLLNNEDQGNPLSVTETGILSEQRTESNTMLLLGAEMAILTLRMIAVFGLLLSLGGLLYIGVNFQNMSDRDPVRFIRTRYGSMLIDIQHADTIDSSTPIDVSSIDDLGKLAERFNAMILHAEFGHSHAYYVQGEGTTYRFVMSSKETVSAVPENEAEISAGES
ncbi:MAG TPA: signal peptidase I [Anaerolineales bacterium]|nr:signal peptidase I [Anaerolineales bacterium]